MRQMTKEEVRLFMESRRVFYFTRDEHPEVDVGFMDAEGDVALWLRRPDFHVQGTVKEGFHCTAYFGVVLIAGATEKWVPLALPFSRGRDYFGPEGRG